MRGTYKLAGLVALVNILIMLQAMQHDQQAPEKTYSLNESLTKLLQAALN